MKKAMLMFTAMLAFNAQATLVFSDNFETGSSLSTITRTASASISTYAGRFGNQIVSQNTSLPAGDYIVNFDLLIIDSWDGIESTWGGPDRMIIRKDGVIVFNHTFAQFAQNLYQSYYPYDSASRRYGSFTGSASYADSIYRISLNIIHEGGPLNLSFQGTGLQSISDESWGLDNMEIHSVNNAPTAVINMPSSLTTSDVQLNVTSEVINLKSNGVIQAHMLPVADGTASVIFDGTSSSDNDGDELSYSWQLESTEGISALSNEAMVSANLAPGEYTATLTVSDGEEEHTATHSFVINELDLLSLSASDIALNGVEAQSVSIDGDQLNAKFSVQELAPYLDRGDSVQVELSGKVRGVDYVRIK